MRTHAVAIVGSGPSGFYAAGALLDSTEPPVRVDMFDRLATPWGLVRAGVAPDHPKIKSVSGQYEKIAAQPGFRFFGHVCLGEDISVEELLERYDAVIYAVGSQTERRLGIDGEDRAGSHASVDFVGWYNGHPDYVGLDPDLAAERAVVIGAGNVALDVARMLLLPDDDLAATDTADHAIEAFAASGVHEVLVCGRRGPVEAAFTTTELRELDDIEGLTVVVDPAQIPDAAGDEDLPKATRRNVEFFRRWAEAGPDDSAPRRMEFRFLRSPVEILGDGEDGPVRGVELAINTLETGDDGRVRPVDTGERETVECGLVLRAVGYRGVALPGVPFDDGSGTIPHAEGRIEGRDREYVVGWIKRGPSGIIGTNRKDANETVRNLLADLGNGAREDATIASAEDVEAWLSERCPDLVDLDGWEAIDAHERAAGEGGGRPRVKVVDRSGLMDLVRQRV
ncbi:FAD-dependent oxidoreductase [Actinomycetospora endophytica]|uniref:ferredoxin--NADP(+) reductase n=1 Tax=Actinomycetospora endophytica TaxID=2291215 RepID=A0ABS8P6M6_9PSEU|nr:FAD-dependent oxidoreductase [Actinomycetospora endophytica]MCD2193893.1 FAD-dependent oxidoreductase [Actinomycetospora endophytica]